MSRDNIHTRGGMLYHIRHVQLHMSLDELSDKTGISTGNIVNIETGKTSMGAKTAEKLGKALNTHPGLLLFPWLPFNVHYVQWDDRDY